MAWSKKNKKQKKKNQRCALVVVMSGRVWFKRLLKVGKGEGIERGTV